MGGRANGHGVDGMSRLFLIFVVIACLNWKTRSAWTGIGGGHMEGEVRWSTYVVVACLLTLIALLVCFGFGLIRLTLFRVQGLPFLTKHLADLTCSTKDALVLASQERQ